MHPHRNDALIYFDMPVGSKVVFSMAHGMPENPAAPFGGLTVLPFTRRECRWAWAANARPAGTLAQPAG